MERPRRARHCVHGGLAVLALAVMLPGCVTYKWISRGPFETSGAIRHVLVDPVNSNRLYAAAENGGLWVLDDVQHAANGWRPLSDNLENLQMRGVAKSSVDGQYLVTANALGFVYHSRDHGATWRKITDQNFQYIRRILISEGLTRIPAGNYTRLAAETKLWIACRIGLYRIRLVNGVFDRTDQLFPRDATQGPDVLDVIKDPINSDILFVGARGNGVWKTANGGESWSLSASWATFGDAASPMIKLATNGKRIVGKLGRNVIVNDQAGEPAAWQATAPVGFTDTGGSDIGYRGNYSGLTGEWHHAVAIHPIDSNVLVAGQSGLFLSNDGGASWSAIGASHEDIQSLAFSSNGDRLFIANDGGVFQRTMATGNLAGLNTRLTTIQFYRVGVRGKVAAGDADHQGIHGTRDLDAETPQWERATRSDSGFGNNALENDFVIVDPTTAGRFYVAFQSQDLLRLRFPPTGSTEDLLPMNATAPAAPLRPFTMRTNNNPVFNQLNYAVGTVAVDPRANSHTILVSTHENLNTAFAIRLTRSGNADPSGGPRNDCGDNNAATFCFATPVAGTAAWTITHDAGATPIVSIAFSPTQPGKAFALDEQGSVIVKDSVDNDDAWRALGRWDVEPGGFARQLIADIASPDRLYAISHGKFVRSTDGGATWNQVGQATLPSIKFNSICTHPTERNVLYLATDTGVLTSRDRGSTWVSIGIGLPNVPVMHVFSESGYLYAVTFGRGLWRTRLAKP